MRGGLILRLVDIVLVLLAALIAVVSIPPADVEPPVSRTDGHSSGHLHPMQIAVTQDGQFLVAGKKGMREISLQGVYDVLDDLEEGRVVEFIADRRSPARLLVDANQIAQASGREAVFLVHVDQSKPK